eukprot:Tamp_09611.p4 GENE.Tamp_09611~~Tamp_09611.p4  ORF type:complete len:125 (+),score=16.51 Tamp_09611:317-691(+)
MRGEGVARAEVPPRVPVCAAALEILVLLALLKRADAAGAMMIRGLYLENGNRDSTRALPTVTVQSMEQSSAATFYGDGLDQGSPGRTSMHRSVWSRSPATVEVLVLSRPSEPDEYQEFLFAPES